MSEERLRLPADIERASMGIIQAELEAQGISLAPDLAPVVKRVIHATADFEYAHTLRFTSGAVDQGIAALRAGSPIVTDTSMARAGISKPSLERLGGEAFCYMGDPAAARLAEERGTTRAAVSMELAAKDHPQALFAVGNAPTALLSLADQIEDGLRPALVIGVPVGFVNVVESKEHLWEVCQSCGVPAIVAMGRKGGSTVATAICNALLYSALGVLDPSKRGWKSSDPR